jgi:hypothetical protein
MTPWGPKDAERHTRKANTPRLKKMWAATANSVLADYDDEAKAVRIANGVVADAKQKRKKGK